MEFVSDSTPDRKFHGPSPEEKENVLASRVDRLLEPYKRNAEMLIANEKGHDRSGYNMSAKQIIRVLETIKKGNLDPYHWPEHFEIPDHIQFVLVNGAGEPFAKDIPAVNFRNPSMFVDALEEFLTVGQIEGL